MESRSGALPRTLAAVAKSIDHSLLRPEMTRAEVIAGCQLARECAVATVCCRPCDVKLCAEQLKGSGVLVCTVVGFPHGSSRTETKVFEAEQAIRDGAVELDMVLNIGALRSGDYEFVKSDIRAVVSAAGNRALVKVILENAFLTDEEKIQACRLADDAGARFVKTSTGYAPSGSKPDDLRLMRGAVSSRVSVKAAGGVKTLDALLEALDAGASRVGASNTRQMLAEFKQRFG